MSHRLVRHESLKSAGHRKPDAGTASLQLTIINPDGTSASFTFGGSTTQPVPIPNPTPAPVPVPTPTPTPAPTPGPGQPAPAWPSYTGLSQFVGTSADGRTNVYVDPSLGAPGLKNATDLVADAPRINALNDNFFGVKGGDTSVIIFALGGATDGTGGADHMSCDYVDGGAIEVCASFGQSARCGALFEAEQSECSMGGNLCGVSTGEALSRWTAMLVSGNALSDFASAPVWQQDGSPDWVDQTEPTDGDYDSIGCGMAFISWLLSQKISFTAIAEALVKLTASGTLAELYATLTGQPANQAWPKFSAAVNALPNGVNSDDPFGGG